MILNIVYLLIGMLVGFLVKHEIDVKQQKKRIESRKKAIAKMDLAPYNETLCIVRELNDSLNNLQNYQNTHKKEV